MLPILPISRNSSKWRTRHAKHQSPHFVTAQAESRKNTTSRAVKGLNPKLTVV